MAKKLSTFLMFDGKAEEAMNLYCALFETKPESVTRWGAEAPTVTGKILQASCTIKGQHLMFFDSNVKHAFGFTPAISLFVDCDDAAEVDRLFAELSKGGAVMMPLDAYPFAKRFAWIADRFGVSWQLRFA
jgi:predicted 3-demethylubiquinone-9 3-methyltransferase (glyoxalase superfamily)